MSGAFITYTNAKTVVPATQVTGSVLYNLDMQNYSAGSPTVWPDTSGNGYNFTFYTGNGGTTPTAPTVTNIGTNQAYFYTNTSIWAKAPSAIMNSTTNYTKAGVIRGLNASGGGPFYQGYFICTLEARDTFWWNNGGTFPGGGGMLAAGNHTSSAYTDVLQAAIGESYNKWYYVSVSFNTSYGWSLYVNGVLVGASSRLNVGQNGTTPVIGATQSSPGVIGNIAAVTVYSRALSATEHAQNAAYWLTRYNGATPA